MLKNNKKKEKPVNTEPTWAKKKSKLKTLTGKKSAEITIGPETKLCGSDGKPMEKRKPKKSKLEESNIAVLVWGRMNPPTKGHQTLIEQANIIAESMEAVPLLFLSSTTGKDNPLTISEKQELALEAFDDYINIIENTTNDIIDILKTLSEEYESLIWVTGEDQISSYERILEDYNEKLFNFKNYSVISAGIRNPDSKDFIEKISASMLREAVKDSDMKLFVEGLPSNLQHKSIQIFEQIKYGLSLYENKPKNLVENMKDKIIKQRFKK